jgi:hypothetical protein
VCPLIYQAPGAATRLVGQLVDAQLLEEVTNGSIVATALSGGPGFALMTPTYDAPGASTDVKLSERLAGLRFHRFDAHVASWTGAGLTADAVKALRPGPERAEIEQENNHRAGTAYQARDPGERLALLACLGALPGS